MSNHFGYNQQFTDKPDMWTIDGYAVVTDGYGNLAIQTVGFSTTGALVLNTSNGPSSVISSITQTANSSGIYNIFLKSTWCQLESVKVVTVIPVGQTPAHAVVQINGNTVGNTGFGPSQSVLQSVKFTVIDMSTDAAGVLAQGCGIHFQLRLKNSSA